MKEAILRDDLFQMRHLIDQYTIDKGKSPKSLDDLVRAGYLRHVPLDPLTRRADTWKYSLDDTYAGADAPEPGVGDVHSGAPGTGTNNVPYSEW